MLNTNEEKYLSKIPADKKVSFFPYDPKAAEIADEIISKIENAIPEADIRFMGASALGTSGQNDIDIYVLASPDNYSRYLPKLKKLFGDPFAGISLIEWSFISSGHEVSIYLDDSEKKTTKEQIKTFEILKNDEDLLAEYEKIKVEASKLFLRDYQRAKYKFYHKILDD